MVESQRNRNTHLLVDINILRIVNDILVSKLLVIYFQLYDPLGCIEGKKSKAG